jgi:hypothetical protein
LFEDRRRYASDKRINNSTCRVYHGWVNRIFSTTSISFYFYESKETQAHDCDRQHNYSDNTVENSVQVASWHFWKVVNFAVFWFFL